jgi:NodT family efflux transporter outer membrane factor (OMF) lipoprotein
MKLSAIHQRHPARWRSLAAVSCAAVLLSACASFKDIHTTGTLQKPEQFATAATLPDQHGLWPDASWAQTIGGTQLQSLIDEAIAGNPNLQIANARVAAARAVTESADASRLPAWSANFNSTYQRFSENYIIPPPYAGSYRSDNALTLNFSYDLDFWGKHGAELRSALSQGKAAQAEEYNARLMIATSVARTWVQLARQYAQLDLNQQQLDVTSRLGHLAQLRFDAGLDAKSEPQQTRQQISNLGAEREQLKEVIGLTRNQLAALLGKGPDRGQQIERPALPADAAVALPDALPLNLIGRRPDIAAARWQVEATGGDIDAAKAEFYPNINLAAFAGFTSIGIDNLLKGGSRVVGVGPAISIPIFERRALRANLKSRVAQYDSNVATYNLALTDALHDVADQVTSIHAVAAQTEQQLHATQAAAANLQLAKQRERVGTTNELPALTANLTLLQQLRTSVDLQARRADLRIGLVKALGGGFDASTIDQSRDDASTPNNSSSARNAS